MAKKPATKAPATPKAAKAPAETPKAETTAPTTETAVASEASPASDAAPAGDDAAPAKKSSGGSRPISYFSSVSTDEYRAGWADIFGKPEDKPAPKAAKPKRKSILPVTFDLDLDSLDAAAREHIEALFRQQAKKKRLNYDKLAANDQVTLQISCVISE